MNLCIINRELGKKKKALEYSLKSLQIDPHSEHANYNCGIIYSFLGQPKAAKKHLEASLKNNKSNKNTLSALGKVLKRMGDHSRGIQMIRRGQGWISMSFQEVKLHQ